MGRVRFRRIRRDLIDADLEPEEATPPMPAHAVFITHHTKRGRRGDAQQVWDRLLRPAIEANADHLAYAYTLAPDDPDVIRAFQLYRSSEAAAELLRTPEYLEYVSAVEANLDGPPEVTTGHSHWIKQPSGR